MQGNTALKPTLLRPKDKGNPTPEMLLERFALLERAEQILVEEYASSKFLGLDKLQRHRIIRWSILQHYEVCATPLLDVTHSLRIAASFASLAKTNPVYLMVVGVPNLSGAITASAEAGLQIMRLSSVCPPSAVRPHIQEGYLLGVYPELGAYADKENYDDYEMDFGRRLVAKFAFDPGSFWKDDDFPQVAEHALYPSEQDDPLHALASRVQRAIGKP